MENTTPTPTSTSTHKVSTNSPVQVVTVLLLVVGSFLLGSLWQKVQFLEKGGTLGAVTGGQADGTAKKYASLDDAMKAMAKTVKIDGGKLVTCMNSGSKKSVVDADAALAESIGVNGTPGFFVNGRFLGGAYPFEAFKELIDKELEGKSSNNVADYSQFLQDAAKQVPPSFDPVPKTIDAGTSPKRGNLTAKVTVIEFSDFQCPYCSKAFPTMEKILKDYGDKVSLVYKHLPLSFHQYAQKAAEASECAGEQGKFWEFHDELFKLQADWTSV